MAYKIKTPIDLELLKSDGGQKELRRSVRARYKPKELVDELISHQEAYRKGK